MLPASEDIETMFAEQYDMALKGIDAEWMEKAAKVFGV